MAGSHRCPFGDSHCGNKFWKDTDSTYDALCSYCRRKYELELAQSSNQVAGERARQIRQDRERANEALGELMVEHPVATIGGLLAAVGIGIALSNNKPSHSHKKNKKR